MKTVDLWTTQSVCDYLYERYGLDHDKINIHSLNNLLESVKESEPKEEIESLVVSAATIGETFFLRHTDHFMWLVQHWLPSVLRNPHKKDQTIRILSAGCATGEEAYSVVAVLKPLLPSTWNIEVLGIDVCRQSLHTARQGEYSLWSMRGVSPKQSENWLKVKGRRVHVEAWVKQCTKFRFHNLLDEINYPEHFDLIFCRNVTIYFHPNAINQVWENILGALAGHGCIIPGPSDPRPSKKFPLEGKWIDECYVYHFQQKPVEDAMSSIEEMEATIPSATNKVNSILEKLRSIKRHVNTPTVTSASQNVKQDHAEEKYQMIVKLMRHGNVDLALKLLRKHTEDYPMHIASQLLKAQLASEQGNYEEALESARNVCYLAPSEPYPIVVMGNILGCQNRLQAAQTRYRWALDLLEKWDDFAVVPFSENLSVQQLREIINGRK